MCQQRDILQPCIWITLCILSSCLSPVLSAPDNSGGCVYSFEVWTPDQNVLQKLRHLEHQCTNNSLVTERRLADIRVQVLAELMKAQNLSNFIERELLEQKLEDVQLKVGQRDLRLEILEIRSDTQELRTMLEETKIKGAGRHSKGAVLAEVQELRAEFITLRTTVGQVKNGVGDLKAEWLLIKRQVQDITSENTQLKFGQNSLKDDTVQLKEMIEEIQTDTQQLKNQQAELQAGLEAGHLQTGEGSEGGGGGGGRNSRMQQQVNELQTQNRDLRRELETMKRDNAQLKREVLAVAVAARNVTPAEVDDWLSRLPTLQGPPGPSGRPGATPAPSPEQHLPRDCHDLYRRGHRMAGVYQVKPESAPQLDNVYCEMINGTGWTIIQRRRDGTLSFNRRWLEYKYGFGNLYGEFWIGNEMMHWLTTQRQTRLRVDMWDWEGQRSFAEYDYFRVDGEHDKYMLHVRGYRGNAGDSLSYHDEMAFSTEDNDNDLHRRSCAVENKGGWWFNSCYSSNLNGVYHTGWYSQGSQTYADGVVWFTHKESEFYSLKHVELKIRPTYT